LEKEEEMTDQLYKKLFFLTLLLVAGLVGALMNAQALISNAGKMPVLTNYHYSTTTHFSYQDKNQVEKWYLTDIIQIKDSIYSIGDFLLIFAGTLLIIIVCSKVIMKIRGKSIDDVLKFSIVKTDGKEELYPNTNSVEAEFIINELKKLKGADSNSSVCIITPHTNQQKLLMEMISKLPERDYFFEKLQLKIMTFDTCQGEERDIVYYSMVATKESDRLWGVFIKDLSKVDIEEEGQIKAQRLKITLR